VLAMLASTAFKTHFRKKKSVEKISRKMTLNIFNFEKNGKICPKLNKSTVPVILKRQRQIQNTVILDLEPWRQ
jgi:tRNA U34 2-thiouridine synthase MnmA/TrmU